MTNRERLLALPGAIALVEHFILEHAPEMPTTEPVTLPRSIFDALCLAALVGIEAAEEDTGGGWIVAQKKSPGG